jgi:hypothetical protein
MDVEGTYEGARAIQRSCNSTVKSQGWFPNRIYDYGQYHIRTGAIGGTFLRIAANSNQPHFDAELHHGSDGHVRFSFHVWPDGSYRIRSVFGGLCLGVRNASTAENALVRQYVCDTSNSQRWRLRPRLLQINLIARHSERCLAVGGSAEGSDARQSTCSEGVSVQRFHVEHVGSIPGLVTIDLYNLKNSSNGKCLVPTGASSATDVIVEQVTCSGAAHEKWIMSIAGDGYVMFANNATGKCLGVLAASTSNGAKVVQKSCTVAPSVQWWWANFTTRHIQLVQVANGNGFDIATANDTAVQKNVALINKLYRRFGTELVYDPLQDKSSVSNQALYDLDGEGEPPIPMLYTCPNGQSAPKEMCAQLYAATFPGKVVIFSRKQGGGYSSGDTGYIVMNQILDNLMCVDVPNVWLLAHEFGHYMGLLHTFNQYDSYASAVNAWILAGNDERAWDHDLLTDTRPEPFITTLNCLAPKSPTAVLPLYDGNLVPRPYTVNTDNILSYYLNASPKLTEKQGAITRMTSLQRDF